MALNNDDLEPKRLFKRRALLLGAAQLAGLGVLANHLHRLQVVDGRRFAPIADTNRFSMQVLAPVRGQIFDRFGRVLAKNVEGFRVTLTPGFGQDVNKSLALLSRIIVLPKDKRAKLALRARRSGPDSPIIIADGLTFEEVAEINLLTPQLPGIQTELSYGRTYPQGNVMGHIVGYIGQVSERALGDDPVLRLPGMRIGKTGIERSQDTRLRGSGGLRKFEVDARGRILRNLEERPANTGADVVLTIDADLQRRVLQRVSNERRASVVALDVRTGEVVALASVPNYNPDDIVSGITEQTWKRMASAAQKPMLNRAVAGIYPPGSTFKMVTAMAGLEAGVISARKRIRCSGQFKLAKQKFRCWKRSGHGSLNLQEALKRSCDVFFYETAHQLGIDKLAAMAKIMGLGQVYDCGIEEQNSGVVPTETWKIGRFNRGWLGGETLLAGIGQGYVLTTPLQLAVMTARIATGRTVVPTLLRRESGEDKPVFADLDVREDFLRQIRKGLDAVVNAPGGTGKNARMAAGAPRVAGKTGTSQVTRRSSQQSQSSLEWKERDHALFVAYAPADNPRYAVAAVVEHGEVGGRIAAPLVRDCLGYILEADAEFAGQMLAAKDQKINSENIEETVAVEKPVRRRGRPRKKRRLQ